MERPYEGKNGNYPLSTKLRLRPGESLPIVFLGDNFMGEEGNDILHGTGNWNLYVMGWIEFIDDLKIKRRTAFCRKYRASDHRFVAVDNEDYEHNN